MNYILQYCQFKSLRNVNFFCVFKNWVFIKVFFFLNVFRFFKYFYQVRKFLNRNFVEKILFEALIFIFLREPFFPDFFLAKIHGEFTKEIRWRACLHFTCNFNHVTYKILNLFAFLRSRSKNVWYFVEIDLIQIRGSERFPGTSVVHFWLFSLMKWKIMLVVSIFYKWTIKSRRSAHYLW